MSCVEIHQYGTTNTSNGCPWTRQSLLLHEVLVLGIARAQGNAQRQSPVHSGHEAGSAASFTGSASTGERSVFSGARRTFASSESFIQASLAWKRHRLSPPYICKPTDAWKRSTNETKRLHLRIRVLHGRPPCLWRATQLLLVQVHSCRARLELLPVSGLFHSSCR